MVNELTPKNQYISKESIFDQIKRLDLMFMTKIQDHDLSNYDTLKQIGNEHTDWQYKLLNAYKECFSSMDEKGLNIYVRLFQQLFCYKDKNNNFYLSQLTNGMLLDGKPIYQHYVLPDSVGKMPKCMRSSPYSSFQALT